MEQIKKTPLKYIFSVYLISIIGDLFFTFVVFGFGNQLHFLIGLLFIVFYFSVLNTFFIMLIGILTKCKNFYKSIYLILITVSLLNIISIAIKKYFNSLPNEIVFNNDSGSIIKRYYFSENAQLVYSYTIVFILILFYCVFMNKFSKTEA
jgi:hypothetical protein